MPFIDLATFDILEKPSPLPDFRERYFECDEEMAGILLVLNRKGYKTSFSCSGHLYDEVTDTFEEENASLSEEELRELYPGIIKIQSDPAGVRHLTLRQNLALKSYVVFAPGIVIPSVPEEWRLDGRTLSHNYYWDSTFEDIRDLADLKSKPFVFYKRRSELLSILFDWAEALPPQEEAAQMQVQVTANTIPQVPDTQNFMRQTYRNGPLL